MRLPKPCLYELRKWAHASNYARAHGWRDSVTHFARPVTKRRVIVLEPGGDQYELVAQVAQRTKIKRNTIQKALARGGSLGKGRWHVRYEWVSAA